MGKTVLANVGVLAVSALLTLVAIGAAGEALLRLRYGALPPGPPHEMRSYADERRGWTLRPGSYSYFDVKAVRRVDVAVSELGLRGAPFERLPAAGVRRISVVGDSFVFGAPLDEHQTITARLQALFGSAAEVLNIAVPGYGTGQEYRLVQQLQRDGYRLGDRVVLAFFTNDLQDNLGLEYASLERNPLQPVFSIDADGVVQQRPGRAPRLTADDAGGLFARSMFAAYLRYQLEVVAVSYPGFLAALQALGVAPALPRTPGVVAGWYGPEWEARWRFTEALLERLVALLRGMPEAPEVYLAFVPSPFQVHEAFQRTVAANAHADERYRDFLSDPDRPQRALEALAQRLQAPFIDFTPALREAGRHKVLYFPREGHFNEAGCEVVAQLLHERLADKGH